MFPSTDPHIHQLIHALDGKVDLLTRMVSDQSSNSATLREILQVLKDIRQGANESGPVAEIRAILGPVVTRLESVSKS